MIRLFIDKISKIFQRSDENVIGIESVSFELDRGKCLGIIGPSGSGKSVIVSLLSGMQIADEGSILYEQLPLQNFNRKDRAKIIQFVFQDSNDALNPFRTVGGLFNDVCVSKNLNRDVFQYQVNAVMKSLMLPSGILQNYISSLSGGQRQRVNIARALLFNPKIIVLDEAFAALDSTTRKGMHRLFKDKMSHGMSVILISHDLDDLFFLSNVLMFIKNGRHISTMEPHNRLLDAMFKITLGQYFYDKMMLSKRLDDAASKLQAML